MYGFLAEHRRRIFGVELFADLFGNRRGRPVGAGFGGGAVLVVGGGVWLVEAPRVCRRVF